MSKIVQLKAAPRARAGKGASRAVRREGLVPGVVYGDKKEPQLISLTYREVQPHVQSGRFLSTLIDLEVDGKTVRAIPARRAVRAGARLHRACRFPAARQGCAHRGRRAGALQEPGVGSRREDRRRAQHRVARRWHFTARPELIPDEIVVDCGALQIGQSIHLSEIKLPEGVTSVARDDVTLCTVTAQAKEEEVAERRSLPKFRPRPRRPAALPAAAAGCAAGKGAHLPRAPAAAAAPAAKKK